MDYIAEPDMFVKYSEVEEINLREYQHLSIEGLRANIRNGMLTQVLASMVGSGKTVMAAHLLHECWKKGRRGAFVVDRLSLLGQTSDVLDRYGIPHGVIQSGHPRYKPGELIQVCSVQTLSKRGWPNADLVIIDEAHVLHNAHKARITKNDGAVIIGLTATPFTRGMGKYFQGIVNVTTGNRLTEEKFLVPFKVWAAAEPDMVGVKTDKFGEWEEKETSNRATRIIGDVVKEYQLHGDNRKSIAFGVDVAHCEEMQRQFLNAGIRAELYTYLTGGDERDIMLKEFRKPDSSIRIMISVAALSRGFDVPDVGCVIKCRPLKKSFTEFVQILGRGLRSYPGKEDCIILDLAGNFMRHYPALVDFMEDGVNVLDDGKPKPPSAKHVTEKKPPVKCPKCAFLPVVGAFCPACGYEFPKKTTVIHERGELGEFMAGTAKRTALTMEQKATLFGELKYYGITKKYAPGWAANKFKDFTGVWPNAFKGELPIPPSAETLLQIEESQRAWAKNKKGRAWMFGKQAKSAPQKSLALELFDLFA